MALELIVVFVLIVVFIVSFCGFIQRIRKNSEENRVRRPTVTISEIIIARPAYINRGASFEDSSGVFPAGLAPPPYHSAYSEYQQDPPPKYDEVVKQPSSNLAPVHQVSVIAPQTRVSATGSAA